MFQRVGLCRMMSFTKKMDWSYMNWVFRGIDLKGGGEFVI